MTLTRRDFLKNATSAALGLGAVAAGILNLEADPFGLPLGLQLYSVRSLLPDHYEETLKKVSALGYRVVEAAGYYHYTVDEVKKSLQAAGLNCVSSHYPMDVLQSSFSDWFGFNQDVGMKYMICSSPGHKPGSGGGSGENFTLDDWKWNADQFNEFGKKTKAAGMQFGYHNHVREFHVTDGKMPYDELMRQTDPALVTFEMDCGWVSVAGQSPVEYLKKYPQRISLLHVKDFKLPPANPAEHPKSTELGHGTIDYHAIFAAAKKGNIKYYFVEQEDFDMPIFDALKIDAQYMQALKA